MKTTELKTDNHITNISDSHVDGLIKDLEDLILERELVINAKHQDFFLLEQKYNTQKKEIDELKAKVDKYYISIDTLLRIKNGGGATKIYRKISNATPGLHKKTRVSKGRLDWISRYNEILSKEQRFMDIRILLDKIVELYPEYNREYKRTPTVYVASTRATALKGKKLVIYNDKVGLPEWVDKHGKPKPAYLSAFIS